jgi:GTPase SAR1 family protein
MSSKISSDNPSNDLAPSSEDVSMRVGHDVSGQVAVGKDITQVSDVHDSEITIGQKVTNFIFGSVEERRAQRNRQAMLELVRNTWIKGVLEKSLHNEVLIELGLEERPDAVEHPWDAVLQIDKESRTLPSGTRIIDVFDEMGSNLLILGEPGSGKTTMLLRLARDLIARAEEDATYPIPVVLNLSSWAETRQPIAGWIVEELGIKYSTPKKVAQPWVENDELLPLLDGLDEVAQEYREECIRAINQFRQEHMVCMAVCTRTREYETLKTQLWLQGAVLLQPLTLELIESYLAKVGSELSAIRETLRQDAALQELAKSPLMLNIMTLAYQGISIGELQSFPSVEAHRRHIFDVYVRRMFERRRSRHSYSPGQTTHWLAWLAHGMVEQAQTVFLIERMEPIWLHTRAQRVLYNLIVKMVLSWTVGSLIGLVYLPSLSDLAIASFLGAVFGLILGLTSRTTIKPAPRVQSSKAAKWSWAEMGKGLLIGLLLSAVIGFIGSADGENLDISSFVRGVFWNGLLFGPMGGLIGGVSGKPLESIEPAEVLQWSWKGAGKGLLLGLVAGSVMTLALGPFMQALMWLIIIIERGSVGKNEIAPSLEPLVAGSCGLFCGMSVGVPLVLVGALLGGTSSNKVESATSPNQGIRRSARNATLLGLATWLISVLVLVLMFGTTAILIIVGFCGALFASTGWIVFGGRAVIQHYALRFILWRKSYLPWKLASFLDYCTERIFLRKVGGGYIFVHRLLQEYFASLYEGE